MDESIRILLKRFLDMDIGDDWDEFAEEIVRLVLAGRRTKS